MTNDSVGALIDAVGSNTGARLAAGGAALETTAMFGVRVGDLHLLLPAHHVEVVRDVEPPTRVPGAPDYIVGLVPHGDGALAILDVARFLGIARQQEIDYSDLSAHRVVGVRGAGLEAGLLCDQAMGVIHVEQSQVRPNQVIKGGRIREFLTEELERNDVRYGIVDLRLLLTAARVRSRREG